MQTVRLHLAKAVQILVMAWVLVSVCVPKEPPIEGIQTDGLPTVMEEPTFPPPPPPHLAGQQS